MPPRRNPYHDPAIREGLNNLAGMFAPPSGTDLAGYATARARQQEAEQLAWLFGNPNDPTASARSALTGRQNYGQTPSGFNKSDATNRYGYDVGAKSVLDKARIEAEAALARQNAQPIILSQNQTATLPNQTQRATGLTPTIMGIQERDPGKAYALPPGAQEGATVMGPPAALSVDQVKAAAVERARRAGEITDQQIVDLITTNTLEVPDPRTGKTTVVTPGRAVREGMSPADTAAPTRTDNFQAMGADGKSFNFLGYPRNGPNGVEIINQATGQVQPNVIRREGTQGGMSFETDSKGNVRVATGNAAGQPTGRVNDLQRQATDAGRAVNELTAMFNNLRSDDVGVAGVVNDALTNYGGQIAPSLARPDVTGTRNQMRVTTLSLAKALVGDDRLSDADRRAAESVSVSGGIDESVVGARAKLASLIVINAYRQRYADTVLKGQKLAPLSPQIVGQLVDGKVIEPAIAQEYIQNNFARGPRPGGVIPGVETPQLPPGLPGAPQTAAPPATTPQQGGDPLAEARAAIARGAPRDAVIQRLQGLGVNPEGL